MSSGNGHPAPIPDRVTDDSTSGVTMQGGTSDDVLRDVERRAWEDPEFVAEIEESQRQNARPLT